MKRPRWQAQLLSVLVYPLALLQAELEVSLRRARIRVDVESLQLYWVAHFAGAVACETRA